MKKLLSILSISGIVVLTGCYGGKAVATSTVSTNPETTTTTTVAPATSTTTGSSTATTEPVTTTTGLSLIASSTEPVVSSTTEPAVSSTTEPVVSTTTEPAVSTTTEPVVSSTTEPVVSTTTEPLTTTTDSTVTSTVTTTTTQGEVIDYENELFISEFYNIAFKEHVYTVSGTNNNKAIELYNPSNETIDLSKYTVKWFSNGNTLENPKGYMELSGTLAPKTCYTLVNSYATDFVKVNGDAEGEVYIGAKSSVGLFKNGQLIDVFGTIGATYESNDDYVINGVASAADVHNVKRNDGARGSVTFVDTDWTVARDGDGSTLGIHEADTTNNTQTQTNEGPTQEQITYFHNFIAENYYNENFTGNKIEIISEKDGYYFEYDFTLWTDDVIVSEDGTIDMDYVNTYGYGCVYVGVKMKDAQGNVICETDENDYDSFGYFYIYPADAE